MVHALRQLHSSLRPRGILLDIHPQPQMPAVIVERDGVPRQVGHVDWTEDNRDIEAARRRLAKLEREGLFRRVERQRFIVADHHASVDAWLTARDERGATSIVPRSTITAARKAMRARGARLMVTLRMRATVLERRAPRRGR